ncbi:hypothetical protein BDQ17DRAFT_672463 [Cyathus striatus]|nr:hypothetical protein BDQ17DRAFT_672463 [Cyathus striatus]
MLWLLGYRMMPLAPVGNLIEIEPWWCLPSRNLFLLQAKIEVGFILTYGANATNLNPDRVILISLNFCGTPAIAVGRKLNGWCGTRSPFDVTQVRWHMIRDFGCSWVVPVVVPMRYTSTYLGIQLLLQIQHWLIGIHDFAVLLRNSGTAGRVRLHSFRPAF